MPNRPIKQPIYELVLPIRQYGCMKSDESDDYPLDSDSIPPIKLTNAGVGKQIAHYLENLIVAGILKPGEKLPAERKLAERFKVSRTSIREALSELESQNLIRRVQGSGSTVLDPLSTTRKLNNMLESSDLELQNATELRESIEPHIASLAAEKARPIRIAALQSILDKETSDTLNQEVSMQLDIQFHLLLAHATGNKLLLTVLQFAFRCTEKTRELSHQTPTGRRISHIGHQQIYDAVSTHNSNAAEYAMKRHLADVHDVSILMN